MISKWAILLLAAVVVFGHSLRAQGTDRSQLWGHAGELWDPEGRLPDYSHAGYRGGNAPLPVLPIVADVTSFGARGNGVTDDINAFRLAVAYVGGLKDGGAIFVPRGRYVIGGILDIDVDRVVLRGEASGPGGSVLYFPTAGRQITGKSKPWIHGLGGLIHVGDRSQNNPGLGPVLTSVVKPQVRGDRTLTVADASGIEVNSHIVLQLLDDGASSLGRHIHNNQAQPGTCSYMPLPWRKAMRVTGVNGNTLTLAQPLRLDVRTTWSPVIRAYWPVQGVGIEKLHLECPPHTYPGHLQEQGFNPITFDGVLDGWMSDVTIENADNGPSLAGLTRGCTIQNVSILGGVDGHHGISIAFAADNLVQDVYIEPLFIHSITLDHQASGNVIRQVFGTNLKLDHHRDGSYENLFSDIDMGWGGAPWASGGSSCAGPRAGARNTYWNLHSPAWNAVQDLPRSPPWAQVQSNLVPARSTIMTANNEWYEAADALASPDLYADQLDRRMRTEVLTKSRHTVATFEDGTLGELGLEEGAYPTFNGGNLWASASGTTRCVDPTNVYGDQVILFEVARGMPRRARVGALVRMGTTQSSLPSGTHVYLERDDTAVGAPSSVRLYVAGPNGVFAKGPGLSLDPETRALAVELTITGTRVQGLVEGRPAIDFNGLAPSVSGFTSFYLSAGSSWAGLGMQHAEVMAQGDGTDLYFDTQGTLWLTIYEPDLFAALEPARFSLSYNGQPMTLMEFAQIVLPNLTDVEFRGANYLTIGIDTSGLKQGDSLSLTYGATDQAVLPWW